MGTATAREAIDTPDSPPPPRQSAIWFLLGLTACHTINDLYGFVIPPLLPALRETFGLSYTQSGLLVFATTFVSAFAQPLVGYWADANRKRRAAIGAGFCLYPVAMLLIGASQTYAALFAGACVLGLAASAYHAQSTTLLLDRFPLNRGFASGIHGMGNSVGFALAPVLAGQLVVRYGWRTAVELLGLPALVAAALVWWRLREPAAQAEKGLRAGFSRPLVFLTLVNGAQLAAVTGFTTFLTAYYRSQGLDLATAGLLTAPTLAAGLISQPLGGAFSDRFGRREVFVAALLGLGGFTILFPHATGATLVLVGLLIGFCAGMTSPVVLVYAAELAPGGRIGQSVGLAWGAGIAISSLAAPATGAAIDHFGFAWADAGLGVLAIAAGLASTWLPRPPRATVDGEG